MTNQQGFPSISSPISGPNGQIQQAWLQLLVSLWNRSGGPIDSTLVAGSYLIGQLGVFSNTLEISGGNLSGDVTTTNGTVTTLSPSGVTPGSYTLSNVTVDTKGRITNATSSPTTGSGNVVLSDSPILITPNLGTPSLIVLTHGTGLPVSTGISGLGTGVATALGLAVTGTGNLVLKTSATLNTPILVAPNLGTPTSVDLANGTNLPATSITGTLPIAHGGTGITSFGTGVQTALGQTVTGGGGIALSQLPVFQFPVTLASTVAALPVPGAAFKGMRAFVTDATLPAAGNFGAGVVGGGANSAPVYCDGAAWFIG